MYKLCKTEQSAKRQREIEYCLFEMLKKKNYEDITITELCERLDMPRKAFYRYFDSKDDSLLALIEHKMHDYSGFDCNENKKRTAKDELENFFLFWYENRELLEMLDKNRLIPRLFESAANFPINDFVNTERYLPNDDEWTKGIIFRFVTCGLVFEAINWYREGFKTSIADLAEIYYRMFSQPLFPSLGKF